MIAYECVFTNYMQREITKAKNILMGYHFMNTSKW